MTVRPQKNYIYRYSIYIPKNKNIGKKWIRKIGNATYKGCIIVPKQVKVIKRNNYNFMDTRLLVVLLPFLVAASWALFNIGRLALQQLKRMS